MASGFAHALSDEQLEDLAAWRAHRNWDALDRLIDSLFTFQAGEVWTYEEVVHLLGPPMHHQMEDGMCNYETADGSYSCILHWDDSRPRRLIAVKRN